MSDAFALTNIASHATDELPLGFLQRLAGLLTLMQADILFSMSRPQGWTPPASEFWLHINSMVEKG